MPCWWIVLRPKQPVARVAEAGQDVADFVQLPVNRRGENRQGGITFADAGNAFRRGNQTDEADSFGTLLLEKIQCGHGAAAGREHRVNEDDFATAQFFRQTFVVKMRDQGGFLALEADET